MTMGSSAAVTEVAKSAAPANAATAVVATENALIVKLLLGYY